MNDNPYRAYWEKAQEQSLKLAQFYTPECLVELALELLQPEGELFDPCCGLGSFLLKAKSGNETLRISGNDIAEDLGELPFEFTHGDYLASEDKEHDYTIANIPFNSKKIHCQLVDENFCWIEKIIKNTRKKALIILPSMVNSAANKKLEKKRQEIIDQGYLELVIQLPPKLFNKVSIAPVIWLINKEKTNKDIYFLNAQRFSELRNKQRFFSEENIRRICQKENWGLATYQQIKDFDYLLMVNVFDKKAFPEAPEPSEEELKTTIRNLAREARESYEKILTEWNNGIGNLLKNLEKEC